MQSEGNSSPVRCTSQTSHPSWPVRLRSRKIGAPSIRAAVAEWLSSAPAAASRAPLPPRGLLVAVFHVGRVVVVGHDHRPAAIPAGDHHHQVAFFEPAILVAQPAAGPGKLEIGLPAERQLAHLRLARHSGLLDQPAVIVQQVVAQGLQVAMMSGQQGLRQRIAGAIGVLLADVSPMRQPDDRSPVGHLERTRGRAAVGERGESGRFHL